MKERKGKLVLFAIGCVLLVAIYAVGSGTILIKPAPGAPKGNPNAVRIATLLNDMEKVDLDSLSALPVERFTLPTASVDIMRVRMEETYDIAGVGRDTVMLKGWIAVKHDDPRPAAGETEVKWGTAVSDTQFVGMDLRGESNIFGPVVITLNPDQPSKGQVGKLNLPQSELLALHHAYLEATTQRPDRPTAGNLKLPKGYERIGETLQGLAKAIESQDPSAMLRLYDQSPGNTFFNAGAGKMFRGAKDYIDFLAPQFTRDKFAVKFNTIRVIEGVPERWAVVEVTGANTIVRDSEGRSGGETPFHMTQVYVKGRTGWLVKYDSWSPIEDPNAVNVQGVRSAAKCRATASVIIKMPRLDLTLRTQNPVVWYSEVETIPPVGYTASISFAPTQVVSDGRSVGTLVSGLVKFREVVRKVELSGTE